MILWGVIDVWRPDVVWLLARHCHLCPRLAEGISDNEGPTITQRRAAPQNHFITIIISPHPQALNTQTPQSGSQRDYSVHVVCVSICLWLCPQSWSCSTPQFWSDCSETSHTCWMWSRRLIVVESRDWCHNVGKININNFCIWHFGVWPIVSKIAQCKRSTPYWKWEESHFKCTTHMHGICGLHAFCLQYKCRLLNC